MAASEAQAGTRTNLAVWSLDKQLIIWVLTVLTVVVGAQSFFNLSWLEDPEFTIKDAVIITPYPGASAREVEEEVTNVIEMAVQQLGQLKYVKSHSTRGVSDVQVTIKDEFGGAELVAVWEQLRRKVNDAQGRLPPGAGTSIVNDDFGDVYGVYVAISGEGFTYKELYETAKFLQRELLLAEDVKRIELYGVQQENVFVEMDRRKMSEFGVAPYDIFSALAAKNLVAESGNATLGNEYIPINPTGEFSSEQQFGELLIHSGGDADRLVFLQDVAQIKRGYQDPPSTLLRINGIPAIGLGVSTVRGGNVINMGNGLQARMDELRPQIPLGIEAHMIAMQSDAVTEAVFGFLTNLVQAVLIVVVVLLLAMGLRSGLIIGAVLFITVMGTFIFMDLFDVTLERISLGALIIALGMLVDNAIVVTDGMRVRMQQGEDARTAARDIVGQTSTPLLAATIIAVLAFAAIGTSEDATGEYCRTLFEVVLISLLFSWLTAVTVTPVFCATFLKTGEAGTGDQEDAYSGALYTGYKAFLGAAIRYRWVTVAVVAGMFGAALIGFGNVKQSFFPDSTRPQFFIDFWFPEGTSIWETESRLQDAADRLSDMEGVEQVAQMVGGRQLRFLLTYTPEKGYYSFAQIIVSVDDHRRIARLSKTSQTELQELLPEAIVNTRLFVLGPSVGGKIQLRISGPDPTRIRDMASEAQAIMESYPHAQGVRNEWGSMVKVVRPELAEVQARRLGIDRPDLARYLAVGTEGTQVGVYRERDELLPIVMRLPEAERFDLENMGSVPVWSPAAQQMIPADQVLTRISTEFENPNIWRRDRNTMLTLHADVTRGLPSQMFAAIKAEIEQALGVDARTEIGQSVAPEDWTAATIPVFDNDQIALLEPGFHMAWGGEAEDSARANAAIASYVPVFFGLMILMVIILFNSIRKTLVIWLTVPMAIIGVTVGLLSFNQPFGFMALLGLMSLAGMLIKNAIVLIDQIDVELTSGSTPFNALLDAGVSRLIPVAMAAGTTILGMMPLLSDAFFIAMAVTIMFGLGFATVLTLIFVPTLYAVLFNIKSTG